MSGKRTVAMQFLILRIGRPAKAKAESESRKRKPKAKAESERASRPEMADEENVAEDTTEIEANVAGYVETAEELKRFMAENKDILCQIRDMRRRISDMKHAVLESMESTGVSRVSAGGLVVELKPCKRVKHDVATLKRLAGDSVTDEYMGDVTEIANVVRIGRPKKKNKKNGAGDQ